MSITLEVKDLRAAAGEAASVAVGSPAAPIFSNVLIEEIGGGKVRFCATDLDSAIDRHVTAVQGELARDPMRTTVSAKFLSAIAAKLPDGGQVTLAMEGNTQLKLTSGRARFTMPTLPAEDFPDFPEEAWDAEFAIKATELASLIDRLAFAMCNEETRYYLNGVYFHRFDAGEGVELLRCATTDGHRLARAQVKLPEGAETLPQTGVIVPRKAVSVIRKLIDHMGAAADGDDPRTVEVSVSAARIRLDFDGTLFTSKLVDGTFPDYSRVIPTGNDKLLKADKATLREAVERVAAIASEKTRAVKLSAGKDLITLAVTSPEAGTATEEVAADYGAAEIEVGFNTRYLSEVLARVDGNTVVLELGDPQGPVLLRAHGEGDPDALFVLMPMRV
jgi:DNA polymerase-3 subunit beta